MGALAGIEANALGAVDVVVAEEGVLPAAEGIEGHRDRIDKATIESPKQRDHGQP